jgi:branched-subunit amino acid transport protein
MSKQAKRQQKLLTDQEVLERVTQKAGWYFYNNLQEARRDFWKRAALWAFLGSPFLSLGAVMGLIILGLARFILPLLALNAVICFLFPIGFSIHSARYEQFPPEYQARWKDYVTFWNCLLLGWIGTFGSVMMLFAAISIFMKNVMNDDIGVGILFVVYLAAGVVLWRRRMIFLRAIAEPEAYPWVRLYLGFSVGTAILSAALLRILLDIVGRTISPAFSSMIVVALGLTVSLLLLGLSLLAWILAYLYYQKWRGVKELKV